MENGPLSNLIPSIKMKKIKLNNDIYPSSHQSNNTTNLINSNQRFNKEQKFSRIKKGQINSLKYQFPQKQKIQVNKIQKIIKEKIDKGNQSVIKFRSRSDIYLPILSRDNNNIITYKQNICNNNNNETKIKLLKKLILNKNQNKSKNSKLEIPINPVSLKFDNSSTIIKRKSKIKGKKFLQRIKDYKNKLKEESFDYKSQNYSLNRTQNYLIDKENNYFNNTNVYMSSINNNYNKNNFKDLSKNFGKIKKTKPFELNRDFINTYRPVVGKFSSDDETKNYNFHTIITK